MRLRALAKINLGLDVVRKREDGYHDLEMLGRGSDDRHVRHHGGRHFGYAADR